MGRVALPGCTLMETREPLNPPKNGGQGVEESPEHPVALQGNLLTRSLAAMPFAVVHIPAYGAGRPVY